MIELVSVEVENFRSFTEARFEPAANGDGITAITGGNGAGKSTLIHAILWALYGVTPDGVPVRALRRQGSTDPVVARVTFRHDGQTVEVTRSLRGKNDTTVANIEVDGVQQTNVSARTATAWVANRLHLDAEAFLTAFVVRQKELDGLVTARPADRRKLIERLAGVERMSEALNLARQTARDAMRTLEAMPAAEEDPDVIAARIDVVAVDAAAAQEAADAAQTLHEEADEAARAADEAAAAHRQLLDERQQATMRLNVVAVELRTVEANVDMLQAEVRYADNLAYAQAGAADAEEALRDAERTITAVDAVVAEADRLQTQTVRLQASADRARADKQAAEEALAAVTAQLDASDAETLTRLETTYREEQQAASLRAGAAANERDRIGASLAALTGHDDPTCPTCETPLPHPETVIASLQTAMAAAVQAIVDAGHESDTVAANLATVAQKLADVAALRSEKARLDDRVAVAATSAGQYASELGEIVVAADMAAEKAFAARKTADDMAAGLEELREQVTDTRRVLSNAERAVEKVKRLPEEEARLIELQAEADTLRSSLEASQGEAESGVRADQVRTEAWQARDTASQMASEQRATAVEAARVLTHAQADYERALLVESRRAAARAEAEKDAAVAAALEEFRRDRLARLAPELSEVASDFVARMTEGKYVTVELDEDFTPMVTDAEGVSRPSSWLSGGEESAVALALRVAIGEVLAGQRGGLLVLDEVLTAQDAPRRAATMAAIRELPRQTVTINHVSEATDMVDHVIEVIPDDVEGSTLVVHDKRGLTFVPDEG